MILATIIRYVAIVCLFSLVITEAYASSPWFVLLNELTGDAGVPAQTNLNYHLMTAPDFHPVLSGTESTFLANNSTTPFAYFAIPSSAGVSSCYSSSTDSNAATTLSTYYSATRNVWDLGMPEFDQSGGCWATSRPDPHGNTDLTNYNNWTNYYLSTLGLSTYLSVSVATRGYLWATLSSNAFSAQYAYDMGTNLELIERNEDEVSGMTPGLAMVRGASAQNSGAAWGIDISTYRYWSNGATVYSGGKLVTGWSDSTENRNLFIGYMGGANVIHLEAADFTTGAASGQVLNPMGLAVQNFYNFAVIRHPNRGTPYVPMAIMEDHYSGFEPSFGEYLNTNIKDKWYWDVAWNNGDTMLANLFGLIYPGYNNWGTVPTPPLVRDGGNNIIESSSFAAYQADLAAGVDPRPWEPFGNSKWGETFNIITNNSTLSTLTQYKVIILSTSSAMSDSLLAILESYVSQGGILIVNAQQLSTNAQTLAGVTLTGTRPSASSEIWVPDGSTIQENSYNYTVVTPVTATLVAKTAGGDPIVTKNNYGSGWVYVTTPDYMEDSSVVGILNVGTKLISTLQSQFAAVTVSGPQLEYLVNKDGANTIVTLVNTDVTGAVWNGTLSFPSSSSSYSASEWVNDVTVPTAPVCGNIVVNATVPAYGVRVYAITAR